tara:strand:+ start:3314 stop:4846 length:1533 start_codon:yes stop_codon:yes gene_type:complete
MFLRLYLFFFLKIKRNYNKIINKKELYLLRKLKSDLANYRLDKIKNIYSTEFEISIRQYLFQKLLGQFFLKQLFFFFNKRKIIFPLPYEWKTVFDKNSFKVSIFSYFLFKILLIFQILSGISFIFKVLIEYFKRDKNLKNYCSNDVIVHNLSLRNLNTLSSNSKNMDAIYWFKKKFPNHNFYFVSKNNQNKNVKYINYFFSYFINDLKLKNFIFNSFKIILKSIYYLLINNWSKVLMTEEIIKKNLLRNINIDKKNFPKKNIFFYTANIYRPLWTYELDGYSDVDLLMTSELSDLTLKNENSEIYENFRGYNLISWPNIYVWTKNNYYEFQVKLPKSKIFLCDPICITDKQINLQFPKRVISVFSYDIVKSYYGISQQIDFLSHDENKNNKFFEDIIYLSEKYNFHILIKNKSKKNKYVTKKNMFYMNKISHKKNVYLIDPDVSPHRIIKNSDAVISFPLTSTYIIGEYYLKPSIYYDPINFLKNKNNINLINSFKELEDWFIELDSKLS